MPLRLKTPSAPASASIPKILVVDDSKTLRDLVGNALRPFICDVTGSTNGFNALFSMERALPDLILLDVNMPIMDGLEMLALLKGKPTLQSIPVIMMTSPVDHVVAGQIAALGVSGTVMKPFTPETLLEKIRSVLPLAPLPAVSSP